MHLLIDPARRLKNLFDHAIISSVQYRRPTLSGRPAPCHQCFIRVQRSRSLVDSGVGRAGVRAQTIKLSRSIRTPLVAHTWK